MKILLTGGAGFIGSNFVNRTLCGGRTEVEIVNVDLLTYAGNLENLDPVRDDPRHKFIRADIADPVAMAEIFAAEQPEYVINFAAESHVDRSIEDPAVFVRTNVNGTLNLLHLARANGVRRFMQVSTDEVYGSLTPDEAAFSETTPLAPNSPYSASKAGADMLVRSFHHTYGMDCVISRCSNNYGPYQFPEKLIPLMISNALEDLELPVYGDGLNVRDWIHVYDHVDGVMAILERGRAGEVYNLGGEAEMPNIEIVRLLLEILGKPASLIKYVTDRPGHDRRYAMNIAKAASELGWHPAVGFADGLRQTVEWYLENRAWWAKIKSGEYRDYYERMYRGR